MEDFSRVDIDSRASSVILLTSILIYGPPIVLSFLLFEFLRHRKPDIYEHENEAYLLSHEKKRLFSWIPFVLSVSDDDISQGYGLDVWIFLRFLVMGKKIAYISIGLSFFLFPLYASHHGLPMDDVFIEKDKKMDFLDKISIANVAPNDWRLAFTIVSGYIMSIFVMYFVQVEYKIYIQRRHEFFSRRGVQQYTVFVSDIPKSLCHPETLMTYMDYLFPNTVHSVYIGIECRHLEELIEERNVFKYCLESAIFEWETNNAKHKRPEHIINRKWFGFVEKGQIVDSIDYYTQELEKADAKVMEERKKIVERQIGGGAFNNKRGDDGSSSSSYGTFVKTSLPSLSSRPTSAITTMRDLFKELPPSSSSFSTTSTGSTMKSWAFFIIKWVKDFYERLLQKRGPPSSEMYRHCAFVSFDSLRSAHAAQQLLQNQNAIKLQILAAPHIQDVMWENFGVAHTLRTSWSLMASFYTFLIVCFWTIPTAYVTSFANIQIDSSMLMIQRIVLEQSTPVLFAMMNGLANIIFKFLATRLEGHLSKNEIDASLFEKLCLFQVFQLFFVSAITGSVLNEMVAMVDHPKLVLFFLGSSIASQSNMFISYTIVQIGIHLPLVLLRIFPLMKNICHQVFFSSFTKIKVIVDDIDLAYALAQHYLILLFIVVFTPIAPLVGYAGGIFFILSEIVYKRHFFFVKHPQTIVHSMGVYWPNLFVYILGALFIAQCTLLGLILLKAASYTWLLLGAFLPCLTLLFYWTIVNLYRYPKAAQNLPLDQCCDLDEERKKDALNFLVGSIYQQPAMQQAYFFSATIENQAGKIADAA
jgi:hypothetical protein